MAMKKRAASTAQSPASKAAETKAEEVKAPLAVLAQQPKAAETAPQETTPAEPKEAKAAEPKAPAKKAEPKSKPAAKKSKAELKVNLVFQYMGREISQTGMIDAVKNAWSSAGKDPSSIESLELYVKPEDSTIYYVVNGTEHGKFDF